MTPISLPLRVVAISAALAAAQTCVPQSQPNPIANSSYPITGTLNGTIAILPISYDLARSIIPAEYPILKKQYQQWLPFLPEDQYPAMLQTELDYDVYLGGVQFPGYFSRAGISFPFVDRLNDGYTAMAYNDNILLATNVSGVIAGFTAYGYIVTSATTRPSCDAYAYVKEGECNDAVYFEAFGNGSSVPGIAWEMAPVRDSPYSVNFWYNVTNQPLFSNNATYCDKFIRLLNTSISQPPYSPTPVRGEVSALSPYFAKTTAWRDVYGLKLDQAFIEIDDQPCDSLKGFSVVDAPIRAAGYAWP